MKLIDLLVQELPKRGGWPDGAVCVVQSIVDGEIYFYDRQYDGNGCMPKMKGKILLPISDDVITGFDGLNPVITRAQYEAALAASQKVEWDGVGLPPVGTKCEIIINEGDLGLCEILFVGASLLVWRQDSTYQEGSGYHRYMKFRPLRSEVDKKRDAVGEAIYRAINWNHEGDVERNSRFEDYCKAYDAIAAGKIPGVRIE